MAQYDDIEILEQKAEEDLLGAEILLDCDHELPALVGFHLQQFLEKKMKASLQRHDVDYPRTHDLSMLLDMFPQGKVSEDDEIFVQVLSQFAVDSRYGEYTEPPWDSDQMLKKAKDFAKFLETLWEGPAD